MAKVKVYTAPSCPFCIRAKDLLKRRGIAFDEILLGWDDEKAWDDLSARTGMQTAPQILKIEAGPDGKPRETLIGGYSELSQLDSRDQLQSLKEP